MTSNIGSDLIRQDRSIGFLTRSDGSVEESAAYERMKSNVLDEVKRFFRPEFLNRIDGTVVFHALSQNHMQQIVELMLADVASNLIQKGVDMEVTDEAKSWLVEEGFDPKFGARPLRRLIQDNIEDQLSDVVLSGAFNPGDTAVIDVDDGKITVLIKSPIEVTSA
jgi:ATP-dependent Clp protease ATP-binding subunit ClpC